MTNKVQRGSKMSRKRYIEFDILRGLSVIGVVLIHITSTMMDNALEPRYGVAVFINQLTRFAVPSFLFLSGFGLTISDKLKDGYLKFLRNRLSRILILYILWSIFYYFYNNNGFDLLGFLSQLLLGNTSYHLYYVPLILIYYVFFPILKKTGVSNTGLILTLIITLFNQIFIDLSDFALIKDEINPLNWVFYFALGIWFSQNLDEKIKFLKGKSKIIFAGFLISLIGIFLETYYMIDEIGVYAAASSVRASVIVYAVLFILLIISINWDSFSLQQLLIMLSKHSYGIYLSHVFILNAFTNWFSGFSSPGTLIYLISSLIFVLATSLILSIAIDQIIDWLGEKIKILI